ncbi:DUF2786 domain-containing protein [Azonexus sp.]|uniref:DUF2786 domain-containing protein n=1 Tax=Azonexus sp. TaxID=1872668 RepID=UPI0027BA1618|nr:DUF2786 domain-containing protein [Azonexus sp.]
MDKRKAIEKIKKCLALSKSANEHEAAAALRHAQKLMAEFKVADLDIEASRASDAKAKSGVTSTPPLWENLLASVVAESFACRLVFAPGWSSRRAEWLFIGCGASPEIAQYAFLVLSRQLRAARAEYIQKTLRRCKTSTKTRRADMFCEGWVRAATALLPALSCSESETRSISAFVAAEYGELAKLEARDRNDGRNLRDHEHRDRWNGHSAGRDAQLNRGVGADVGPLSLGVR